jgi:hypothetical protein
VDRRGVQGIEPQRSLHEGPDVDRPQDGIEHNERVGQVALERNHRARCDIGHVGDPLRHENRLAGRLEDKTEYSSAGEVGQVVAPGDEELQRQATGEVEPMQVASQAGDPGAGAARGERRHHRSPLR